MGKKAKKAKKYDSVIFFILNEEDPVDSARTLINSLVESTRENIRIEVCALLDGSPRLPTTFVGNGLEFKNEFIEYISRMVNQNPETRIRLKIT